jgi:Fe-S-cluster containining protein
VILKTFLSELAAVMAEVNPNQPVETCPPPRAVDCGPCRACCHMAVFLTPWDIGEDYLTEHGGRNLKRATDGACVYLGEAGCSIYERRPVACRAFHCGEFVRNANLEAAPDWNGSRAQKLQFRRVIAEGNRRNQTAHD